MNFDLSKIIKRLIPIILIGIVGNILLTLYTSDDKFIDSLSQFSPYYFVIALLISLLPWLGHTWRTVIWSKFLNSPISFKDSFRIALAHDLGGAITPTVVGGTPLKFGLLVSKGIPTGSAGMIILLQVSEDLVFLLTSLPLSIYFAGGWDDPVISNLMATISEKSIHLWWIIPSLVMVILLVRFTYQSQKKKEDTTSELSWLQRLKSKFSHAWTDFRVAGGMILKSGKLRFLLTVTIMYIEWTCRFIIPIVLVMALGIQADPFQLFFLHWLVWLTMLVTPTPGATGGAEAVFYFLFLPLIPESLMGILITGWRFTSYYFMMLVGAILLQIMGIGSLKGK